MKAMKKLLALMLVLAMALGMVACGKTVANQETDKAVGSLENQENSSLQLPEDPEALSRPDKELVAELIDGEADASEMTDEELDTLIDQLIGEAQQEQAGSGVVNLSIGSKTEQPSVDVSENKDAYNEDGEMTKPFDQVYPELIEKEQVAFSGESILIKMKKNTLTDGLKAAGIGALEEIVPLDGCAWYEAMLIEGTDAQEALAAVRELKEVLLAEYNYEIQVAALDDYKHFDKEQDEDFKKNGHNKDQWHFHHCGIVDGYEEMEKDGGDPSVIVAVIDSGVDYNHEDLKDNMWVNAKEIPDNGRDDDGNGYVDDYYGVDIVAGKGSGNDTNGHGTHVAGIIAAKNNNTGVLGIAYNVKIMSVKAAMHNGSLNQADIAKAVLYAYENGAEVINMSFGGTACSIAVQDALATAYTRCVLVASAGNLGENNEPTPVDPIAVPNYPAALTYVLGVMSVDETGRESAFTNWDVYKYNGVEYEVYAPGENIMSTLPGNQYGYLSGTSMAAPVVSAFAAILRSEFSDRDKYPTEFIYGQLACTSEIFADCLNPEAHGFHNLPQVVDLNAALTKLPKPELNVQEYYLFDDPKYSDKNNGDGVIDAGETIALGLVLRNRWGMSENTQVTIDTISASSGMTDPYITIQNPTVDYGSVGTYSTQDCGKVYTDELFTGWEAPFLITISDDCPNDYRFTLNVVIRCENALDEDDNTLYVFGDDPLDPPTLEPRDPISVNENVRSGYILPSIIEEDMVLTKDNLYIIPNATVITEGTTVRVEPGTHIQFWSDDANDPYADSYIAYLLVNGNFLVEGTKENPVYIYPSQLMDHYGVEISSSSTGYVSLKYADITNFFYGTDHTSTGNKIDLADHCTFRNNYSGRIYYRYLSGGVVKNTTSTGGGIGNVNAKDCVFYKIAFESDTNLFGAASRCIYIQCGIDYKGTYESCVFLGNSMVDQTLANRSNNSAIGAKNWSSYTFKVVYRAETGTTYIAGTRETLETPYFTELGADFSIIETPEELAWIKGNLSYGHSFDLGLYYDAQLEKLVWHNGTEIDSFIDKDNLITSKKALYLNLSSGAFGTEKYGSNFALYELPGQILPTDITFNEYAVTIDLEATYQIAPLSVPVQLPVNGFLYESSDEGVLTVSDTGLVTPVGKGTADVWVYSLDKAVKNRVTITVKDYVPLSSMAFPADTAEVAAGETIALGCTLSPVDTTRRNVQYTSSNEAVATVNEGGVVTGVSSGTATITATCEGFTDTVSVKVYTKATSLELSSWAMTVALSDGTADLPQAITNEGAETILSWRSTDEAVATVENGKLTLKDLGTTSVIVTDNRSGLSAACLVIVSEKKQSVIRDVQANGDEHLVLLENGELYHWDQDAHTTLTCIMTDVASIGTVNYSYGVTMVLLKDGTIKKKFLSYNRHELLTDAFAGKDVVEYKSYYNTGNSSNYIRLANGNCYAWGEHNSSGQLGVGITGIVTEPLLINLDGVVDIEASFSTAWFLTDKGELYASGALGYATVDTPTRIDTGVAEILRGADKVCYYLSASGDLKVFNGTPAAASRYDTYHLGLSSMDEVAFYANGYSGIGCKDGKIYTFAIDTTEVTQVPGITDAVDVYTYEGTHYIVTESGLLFGLGKNDTSKNHMAGVTTEALITSPVMIPIVPLAEDTLRVTTEPGDGVLTGDTLVLTFNKALNSAVPKLYGDGTQMTVQSAIDDYNHLLVTRSAGFREGVSYELVFDAGTIHCAGGVTNTEEIRIAFTWQPDGTVTPDAGAEDTTTESTAPVVYESILDESIERVLTAEKVREELKAYIAETQYNPNFTGNAILNPISTDFEVSHWLRPMAPTITAGTYSEIPLGGNYWGTTNETAIGLQMVDYTDFINYARLMYAPYLTEAPENTFPFVTSVKLFNKYGEEVTTVGNEKVTFQVKFNRDMDTSIPLQVRFGSAYPYGDYEVEGRYVDARTWEGVYTLNTLIENGNQYFTISNGCSATDDLELQLDQYRFGFVIDTTAAQALVMQGTALDTGIELKWTQDDFKTLMGYNVYRSDKEDGLYTRLNSTVIPAKTMEWFDDTVEPGEIYYYNFTVVQTDLTESEPSGKIVIMSKDTMAPNIYHSPVSGAFTGSNLVVSATITDNLNIAYANLYYRIAGTEEWNIIRMNKLNDKYSAIIPAAYMTTAGVEYYIQAFDGVSSTYKGSEDTPYTIAVQEAMDADSLGDVDGDGVITNLDALLLLYEINDKQNLTREQFVRADLNGDGELWAAEALRILQYVSGEVGSLKM